MTGGTTENTRTEEHTVSADGLLDRIREIIREGNVRHIVIKHADGRTLIEFPLTIGVVGVALLPVWAGVGAIVALAADFRIVVTKDGGAPA